MLDDFKIEFPPIFDLEKPESRGPNAFTRFVPSSQKRLDAVRWIYVSNSDVNRLA